jgi:hypothetical protein
MSDVHHTVSTSDEFAEVAMIQGSARRHYFPPEVKARIAEGHQGRAPGGPAAVTILGSDNRATAIRWHAIVGPLNGRHLGL